MKLRIPFDKRLRQLAKFAKSPEVTFLVSALALAGTAWTYGTNFITRNSVAMRVANLAHRTTGNSATGNTSVGSLSMILINNGNRDVVILSIDAGQLIGSDSKPIGSSLVSVATEPNVPMLIKPAEIKSLQVLLDPHINLQTLSLVDSIGVVHSSISFSIQTMDTRANTYTCSYPAIDFWRDTRGDNIVRTMAILPFISNIVKNTSNCK
jgi:hypothetical protein